MSSQPQLNMTTLMKRLEAATSRLEDLASYVEDSRPAAPPNSAAPPTRGPAPVASAPAAVDLPPSGAVSPKTVTASDKGSINTVLTGSDAPATAKNVLKTTDPFGADAGASAVPQEFVALQDSLEKLQKLSSSIDKVLAEQTVLFIEAAKATLDTIEIAAISKEPDVTSPEFAELLQPISSKVGAITEVREKNRASKVPNHLATLAEGAPALGWITQKKPVPYIQDFKDSATFYANRVLKDHRENPNHTQWVKAVLTYYNELKAAVQSQFPTGLKWNPQGAPVSESIATHKNSKTSSHVPVNAAPAAALSGRGPSPTSVPGTAPGGPPAPPPPPSAESLAAAASSASGATSGSKQGAGGSMSAVFADLNQGTGITSALKHVDRKAVKEQSKSLPPKPAPRPASLRSASSSTGPAKAAASGTAAPKATRPPKKELVDNRWVVENFQEAEDIVLEVEMTQTVYIDNCEKSTIQIKGKANAVTINKCKRTGVVVDTLVSGVEVIKSTDLGLQVTGTLHSLTIDQSHSVQVYVNENALDVEIYTSQTTAINVNIPTGVEGDYTEVPLPEQVLHKIDGKAIKSSVVRLN